MTTCILSIGGSDSGGGAGIQADLKTCAALGVFGTTAITAITAQNTQRVASIQEADTALLAEQIDLVLEEFPIAAIKTGMLFSKALIEVVVEKLRRLERKVFLVVDPVMVASSGGVLLQSDAIECLLDRLLPLASLVTPNIPEMQVLCGMKVESESEVQKACQHLHSKIRTSILLKGGHRSDSAQDTLYSDGSFEVFTAKKIPTQSHGTGCTLATAIACYLAKGCTLQHAVLSAKAFVTQALENPITLTNGLTLLNTHSRYFV